MTGPGPGWHFDPDDGEAERYWNGDAWTEHRRSRLNASELPLDSRSDAFAPDYQDVLLDAPTPASVAPGTPSAANSARPPATSNPTQDTNQRSRSRETAATPVQTPDRDAAAADPKLQVGGRAKVVSEAYVHHGQTGTVESLLDEDEVGLLFDGETDVFTFRRAAVEAVHTLTSDSRSRNAASRAMAGPSDSRDTPEASAAKLVVGGRAMVVDADRRYKGRVGKIVSISSHGVSLKFDGSVGSFDFPRSRVIPVADPPAREATSRATTRPEEPRLGPKPSSASTPPSPGSGPATTARDSTELSVGGLAKVVVGDRRYADRVGAVVSLERDAVELRFKGSFGTFSFRRNHVIGIATEDGQHYPDKPLSSSGGNSVTPLQRFWAGLPAVGRIAFVLVPALALIGIIAAIVSANSRDEASYRYGHDALSPEAATLASVGVGGDAKYRCEQAYTIEAGIGNATKFVKDDVLAGCVDGVGK